MPLPDNAAEQARQNRRKNRIDRRKVKQNTREEIAAAIANVDDPDAREALSLMYEVLSGDTPDETRGNSGQGNSGQGNSGKGNSGRGNSGRGNGP